MQTHTGEAGMILPTRVSDRVITLTQSYAVPSDKGMRMFTYIQITSHIYDILPIIILTYSIADTLTDVFRRYRASQSDYPGPCIHNPRQGKSFLFCKQNRAECLVREGLA